jgi:hypothetical protein
MALVSQQYLSVPEDPELQAETGWPDVRLAILKILVGYLLAIVCCVELAGVVTYLVLNHPAKATRDEATAGEAVAMIGLLLFVLGQLYSVVLIVRGSWTCLLRSPERCHAKWFMFACILFVLIGPVCGFFSGMLMASAPPPHLEAKADGKEERDEDKDTVVGMVRNLEQYRNREHVATASGILQLVSHALSWMSSLLFILYLRSVARCWENEICVRLVDLYLIFSGGLVVSGIGIFTFSPEMLAQLTLSLGLAVGGGLALVWFLFLLFMTSTCISAGLAARQSVMAGA